MHHVHKRRLLKLAAFLDTLPRAKFDFSIIARQDGLPFLKALKAGDKACGTVACAVGWMPAVFPRAFRWDTGGTVYPKNLSGVTGLDLYAAGQFFGLPDNDINYLFTPDSSGLREKATPKQVARHIRRYVQDHE